jgi:predicted metal-dependent HD superfamily phosphohydrolase
VIPDAGALADDLVARYGAKRRMAYRERYLVGVLEALDALEQLCTDPVAVRLAAWFHRAVHAKANTASEDAEASARLAEELLPTYGVNAVRTAEVVRLVRLTGGETAQAGANGDVLLDAVDAVLADPQYVTHASEVRRNSRFDVKVRREQVQALLDSEHIYRTDLAAERYDTAARTHLAAELELLDGLEPSPWRGWQRRGLAVLAVLTAFVAFLAGVDAIGQPWRVPAFEGDPKWQAILMAAVAAGSVAALWWAVRRSGRKAGVVTAIPAAAGVVGVLVILFNVPPTTGAAGVGQRVPLLMTVSVLLIVASGAAFAATRFKPGIPRNRGQLLAGSGAVAVVVLLVLFVIVPVQSAYLDGATEYVEDLHQPANLDVASVVNGATLWTSRGRIEFGETVGTAHGIAVARGRGTVEMIDPATGRTRWRYIRANTEESPDLYPLDSGRHLLVSYDDVGYLVLDTATGRRTATWSAGTRDYDIQNSDPLVTGKTVSKGSDKLFGTNLDGSARWTYAPGRCTSISSAAVGDTAVVTLHHSCGRDPDQVVGLDLKNGKKRWSRDVSLQSVTAAGDLIVGIGTPADGGGRQLTAIDPHTGADKWASKIPGEWSCTLRIAWSGQRVVLAACPNDAQRRNDTVVRLIDPATGTAVATVDAGLPAESRFAAIGNRVFVAGWSRRDTCWISKITEGAPVERFDLGEDVDCSAGVVAAGNLVLVGGRGSLIALK